MLPRHAFRQALRRAPQALAQASYSPSTTLHTAYAARPASALPLPLKSWLPATRLASSASSSPASPTPTASQEAQEPPSDASAASGQQPSHEEGSPDDRFSTAASEELLQAPGSSPSQPIGKIERRLSITFTCTVPDCGHRSSHEFSRLAYERGIVLCQCPACLTRHLIADHLGWFDSDDLTQGGKYKNIEALLKAKGETVSRARILGDGTVEVEDDSDSDAEGQP